MLKNNLTDGYNYRYRRHEDWATIYELYRDKVTINRLTQRQSVNIPLMKTVVKTALKDIDDMPVLYFENLDNDKQAELYKNEYWKWTQEQNHMDLQDVVDKRQVLLFGRSFDQWQIAEGRVKMTVQDSQDILVSRYMNPFDLHTSRYLIHLHIFTPLSSLGLDPDVDKQAVMDLKTWYATKQGLIKIAQNAQLLAEKNKKMKDMGVPDVESPILGETYVEETLHFVFRDNEKDAAGNTLPTQIFVYRVAENMRTLMKKRLEAVIGETKDHYWRDHYPYVTWADDLERQDFWSDSDKSSAFLARTSSILISGGVAGG